MGLESAAQHLLTALPSRRVFELEIHPLAARRPGHGAFVESESAQQTWESRLEVWRTIISIHPGAFDVVVGESEPPRR